MHDLEAGSVRTAVVKGRVRTSQCQSSEFKPEASQDCILLRIWWNCISTTSRSRQHCLEATLLRIPPAAEAALPEMDIKLDGPRGPGLPADDA